MEVARVEGRRGPCKRKWRGTEHRTEKRSSEFSLA